MPGLNICHVGFIPGASEFPRNAFTLQSRFTQWFREVRHQHSIVVQLQGEYKSKFGAMEASNARKLKAVEDGDVKLKKLLVEQMVGNANQLAWRLNTVSCRLCHACKST